MVTLTRDTGHAPTPIGPLFLDLNVVGINQFSITIADTYPKHSIGVVT